MNGFVYEKDANNIVTITMDMTGPVNTMNAEFRTLFPQTVERLEKERNNIAGVILASAKKTFFAGGDLKELVSIEKGGEEKFFKEGLEMKSFLRRLECLGKPVVAAINGVALGGGYE
ncbi:MAG: 3-hydroxyacyl-CoA dehydrogenase, partial [Deltaproteobacteria bacterium]